jgi:pimeloyl-ACP methyl ester carboxylesterase
VPHPGPGNGFRAGRVFGHYARDRFVEIPRAVHTLREDNPEAVLDALREFLGF